jgi:hypothetical protein
MPFHTHSFEDVFCQGCSILLNETVPPSYARRPPHIHILVDMKNYAGLITQHYPKAGNREASFDLVLERE